MLTWLNFGFALTLMLGGFLFCWGAVVTAPTFGLLGTVVLNLGLVLFFAATAIGAAAGGLPVVAAGVVELVAMVIVLFGLVLIFKQSWEDKKLPILGPENFPLFGCFFFGTGAACFFCSGIRQFGLPAYANSGLEPFGAMMAATGSSFFSLSAQRNFLNAEGGDAPSIPSLKHLPVQQWNVQVFHAGFYLNNIGAIVAVGGLLYGGATTTLWVALAGFSVMFCGSALGTVVGFLSLAPLAGASELAFAIGSGLAAAWAAVSAVPATANISAILAIVIGAVFIVGGVVEFVFACTKAIIPWASYGNIIFYSSLLSVGGGLSMLVFGGLAYSGNPAVAVGLVQLWVFLILLSNVIRLLMSGFCVEVAKSISFSDAQFDATSQAPDAVKKDPDWGTPTPFTSPYEVLVIGGGPAGLTLSIELGNRGVQTLLIETRKTIVPDSRFFSINAASMEGLRRTDVVKYLLKEGHPTAAPWGASFSSGMSHAVNDVYCLVKAPNRDTLEQLGMMLTKFTCLVVVHLSIVPVKLNDLFKVFKKDVCTKLHPKLNVLN